MDLIAGSAKLSLQPDLVIFRASDEQRPQNDVLGHNGEIEMSVEKVPMTIEGYGAIEVELLRLKTVERPSIIRAIAEARAHGDLSENAEYHAAKDAQGLNEARVAELEGQISRADVIDPTKLSGKQIKFGAIVSLIDEDTGEKVTYRIVGEYEADVKQGKISITSPIARALIGKTVKDTAEVSTPGGGKLYEIVRVRYPK